MTCECISSNAPERGGTVPEVVLAFPFEPARAVSIDSCIVDAIKALWRAGIATLGSCCGHGEVPPSVVLSDKNGEEARAVLADVDSRQWTVLAWVLTEVGADVETRCAHPDRLWGTCGIPASMHEETFEWAKGGKFFHEFTPPADESDTERSRPADAGDQNPSAAPREEDARD